LHAGAAILRTQRKHVDLYIATLHGRRSSGQHPKDGAIRMLGSDDFWGALTAPQKPSLWLAL
jgi:hypothetical protein